MEKRRHARTHLARVRRQRLWEDMDAMSDAVAEEAGMRLTYCPSIDFSILPFVVALLFDERQGKENGCVIADDDKDVLDSLRFLAQNGRILPKTLFEQNADMGTFREYVASNEDAVLKEIRGIYEGHYLEWVGHSFGG